MQRVATTFCFLRKSTTGLFAILSSCAHFLWARNIFAKRKANEIKLLPTRKEYQCERVSVKYETDK